MIEEVQVAKIPSGLVENWTGIVYSYKTNLEDASVEEHEALVNPAIEKQISESFDHWTELRIVKQELLILESYNQVTLVKYRIKDSY